MKSFQDTTALKYFIFLVIVTMIGGFFRIWHITTLPPELHRDESAIGFNAYLIGEIAVDEHGKGPCPLVFESFGDFKLPGLIYLVALMNLFIADPILALRLPTALASTLLIPIFFWLSHELFHRKKISIFTSIVIAVSPWAVLLGRTAYEPILGLTFFWLTLCCILAGRRSLTLLFISLVPLLAAMWSYNTPTLLFVLLLPIVLVIFKHEYLRYKKWFYIWLVVLFLLFGLTFFAQLPATTAKTGTTLFQSQELLAQSQSWQDALFRGDVSYRTRQIVAHPLILAFFHATTGYFESWNVSFLLGGANSNPWHSYGVIGVGYITFTMLLAFLYGIFSFLHDGKRTKEGWLLLGILLIAPLPSALTIDAPNINRLVIFLSVLSLWSAYGFYRFYCKSLTNRHFMMIFILVITIELVLLSTTAVRYSMLYAKILNPAWIPGIRQSITQVNKLPKYDLVIWDSTSTAGTSALTGSYAEIAWLSGIKPASYLDSARWKDGSGLREVEYFDHHFIGPAPVENAQWYEVGAKLKLLGSENVLVVTRNNRFPHGDLVSTVTSESTENQWSIFHVTLIEGLPEYREPRR